MDTRINAAQATKTSNATPRLRIARVLWAVLIILALWFFVNGIPLRYAILQTPCTAPDCAPLQLTSDRVQLLSSIPMSLDDYGRYVLAIEVIIAVGFIGAGLIIVWRRSDTPIGLFISLSFITFGSNVVVNGTGQGSFRETNALSLLVVMCGWLTFGLLFYVFPDGEFRPRWTRIVGVGVVVMLVVWVLFDLPRTPDSWPPLMAALVLLFLGGGAASQIYRYRHFSTPIQQQQTKWIVVGMAGTVLGGSGISFLSFLVGQSLRSPALLFIIGPLSWLFLLCLPVTFVIALLYYRLWDVDRVINRTLVYLPLTAVLAGILAASQAILEKLAIALTGSNSEITTIITTLLLVSMFTPLQTGLQALVDKRFKVGANPTAKLLALSSRVQTLIDDLDVSVVSRNYLEEAVRAFGSPSGAIYLMESGQLRLIHQIGNWRDDASRLCVPLETDNLVLGQLCIAARDNQIEYSKQEKEVLEKAVISLARAIKLTRQMFA